MKLNTRSDSKLSFLVAVLAGSALVPTALAAGAASNAEDTVVLRGVFRDFRAASVGSGGHPDFETTPANGRGLYLGIAKDTLNSLGIPEFNCTGHKVTACAKDASGRFIIGSKPYLAARPGDTACAMSDTDDGAVKSASSFSQWFNETLASMSSCQASLKLTRTGSMYTYDGNPHSDLSKVTGSGNNQNWDYTFEVGTEFYFDASRNDTIVCAADDAMWVYIDGRLVIDLGGSHDKMEQTFELNRLSGLVNGQKYELKIFYAERNKPNSWLKFQTSLQPIPLYPPAVSGKYD